MTSTLGLSTHESTSRRDSVSATATTGGHVLNLEPGRKSHLVFLTDPFGLPTEQYKILRRRLINVYPNGGVFLITSPGPGEGKTLISTNLAWSLADAGHRTCLVDLDFRAPGVFHTLGAPACTDGVEDLLDGRRTLKQVVHQIADTNLHVLGVRKRLDSPGKLLSSSAMLPLLAQLRVEFEWVILDFAPVIPMADVSEVLPHVTGALMVIRSGKTSRKMIPASLEILGSRLCGVVLNDAVIQGSAYYGSYGSSRP